MKLASVPAKSRQIADYLRNRIESGALAPGTQLRSIRELAGEFSVSNKVVFTAHALLEEAGLVRREHGRGIFVAERPASARTSTLCGLLTQFREQDVEGYFDALNNECHARGTLATSIPLDAEGTWQAALKLLGDQAPAVLFVDIYPRIPISRIRELAGPVPLCFVHRWQWETPPEAPAVLVDFAAMWATALRFLRARGHSRIAVVGAHHRPHIDYKGPLEGGAERVGMTFPSYDLPYICYRDFQDRPDRVAEIFHGADRPTAVIGIADYLVSLFRDQLERLYPACNGIETVGAYDTMWSRQPGREFHSFRIDFRQLWRAAMIQVFEKTPAEREVQWFPAEFVQKAP